jgi:hypothetical protein
MCYVKNPSNPACQEACGLNLKGAIGGKYGIISLPTNSINALRSQDMKLVKTSVLSRLVQAVLRLLISS